MEPIIFKVGNQNKELGLNIASFDFDWTIVKPKNGKTFPKDEDDWEFLRLDTKTIIKNIAKTHDLVIFTSQTKEWKIQMIKNVLEQIGEDFTVCIGFGKKTLVKKPNKDLFYSVIKDFDKKTSFYVGDAAGRDTDWSDEDKKFAENVGIKFMTPEEVFPIDIQYKLKQKKFHKNYQEMIILVGYPSSTKSSFAQKYLETHNYTIISGDILKTLPKILKEAEKNIIEKKSVVIDRTNPKKEDRLKFIDLANKYNIKVRIFVFRLSIEQAIELSTKRYEATGKKIPKVAFYTFRKNFQEPDEADVVDIVYT